MFFMSFEILNLMGNPLVAVFIEVQHEPKFGRGATKRLKAKLAVPTSGF